MTAFIFKHPVNQLTKSILNTSRQRVLRMKAVFASRDNLVTKVTESVASSGKLYRLPPNKEKTVTSVIQDCHYKSRAGDSATMSVNPGYSYRKQRKIEPKELPSCTGPLLLIAFTRKLEILATALCNYN